MLTKLLLGRNLLRQLVIFVTTVKVGKIQSTLTSLPELSIKCIVSAGAQKVT